MSAACNKMKLHFEANLDYQLSAIDAVCDLFRGQENNQTPFALGRPTPDDLGVGNRLRLPDEAILANLEEVQIRNGLCPSPALASGNFTVEMETGTGKTYVYLRSIFELNRRYGFTKFVIVVPSVAIKEGVYKTLQITGQHFGGLYANVPFDYFLYDSARLGQVRNFATSPHIQIMVVTVGAINKKDVNNLYKPSEKTGDERPIDLIRSTRPILIVDEPQSVDGGLQGRGKQALDAMDPLCTLRYSATHADEHHMLYRLDAVDACQRRLVKQIEVAAVDVDAGYNRPYARLLSARLERGQIAARLEVDVQTAKGVCRRTKTVRDGDDLERLTGRAIYGGLKIGEIRVAKGAESLELRTPGGELRLKIGQAHGDAAALAVQREMIRRTIEEHLNKELRLTPRGIKVLSLFFIDAVDRYRRYDADGRPLKGDYAVIFEEEFRRLAQQPDYRRLFQGTDVEAAAAAVHEGYFSVDRRGVGARTIEVFKDTRGDSKADGDTYNLIMRKKEELLSLDTPLRFIFSHSALKEGWDNPNVFQICALREMGTDVQRRQTIGRGLRLCVDQSGNRVRDPDVNILTVIAAEGYEQFAESLQKEIETDTGIRFGMVQRQQFALIPITDALGRAASLGLAASETIWTHLRDSGCLDAAGRIQDRLRKALRDDALGLPEEFAAHRPAVAGILRKLAGRLEIRKVVQASRLPGMPSVPRLPGGSADRLIEVNDLPIWFDAEALIGDCIIALRERRPSPRRDSFGERPTLPLAAAASRREKRPTQLQSSSTRTISSYPTC